MNISSNDIVDGNAKLILGLVWSIILHWQVSNTRLVGFADRLPVFWIAPSVVLTNDPQI